MEIVKFEDGQLIRAAYVRIDHVEHEVTPSEYSGNTPLSSYNLNRMQRNLLTYKVKQKITTKSTAGAEIELPCYYKVGQDVLDVFLNGEKLLLSSSEEGNDGHYQEVGELDSISKKIQITMDGNLESGDMLELVVRGKYYDTEM